MGSGLPLDSPHPLLVLGVGSTISVIRGIMCSTPDTREVEIVMPHSTSVSTKNDQISPCSFPLTTLICFLFGVFGIHRFYVGKIGTGILQVITLEGLSICSIYDLVILILGDFTDKDGLIIKQR